MAVGNLALQHIKEFEPGMLEDGEDIGLVGQGDEVGLDDERTMRRVTEQLVLVAGAGAAALDGEALSRLDEGRLVGLLEGAEKRRHGTWRARERDCSVESEGEVVPFSILDSNAGGNP
jgi:hypothetical protein